MRLLLSLSCLAFSSFCLGWGSVAQADEYDDFPKSGMLAAAGTLPSGSISLPQLPMGMTGKRVPLIGSVSLSKDQNWTFSVQNTSDRPIKVSIDFAEYNAYRDRTSTKSFTYKLKPGTSGGQKITGDKNAVGGVLILNNWGWLKD